MVVTEEAMGWMTEVIREVKAGVRSPVIRAIVPKLNHVNYAVSKIFFNTWIYYWSAATCIV